MEFFSIIERIIGHLAWPFATYFVVTQFGEELRGFIRRIKNAKYKDIEINLENDIQKIKVEAESAGVTIAYSSIAFPEDSIRNIEVAPEWAFIKSWQEIDNVVQQLNSKYLGSEKLRGPTSLILSALFAQGIISQEMLHLIGSIQQVRNKIVHSSNSDVTRGEALEWLGISKSIKDRLAQKL